MKGVVNVAGTFLPFQKIKQQEDEYLCSTGKSVLTATGWRCSLPGGNQCLYSNTLNDFKTGDRINNSTVIKDGICDLDNPYCSNGQCIPNGSIGAPCTDNNICNDPNKVLTLTQQQNLKEKNINLVMGPYCRYNRCSGVQGYYWDKVPSVDACRNYNATKGPSKIENGRCIPGGTGSS